ncbi:MAG TPA: cbb3-type cytochrome c oxidase subunit I [Polyangia bacterium]|jgi:cytochrome c oxidase cbb3-type subunit 1|nr:cbb3-type cytochrome c oxidase subunit I [Polyangia bacterium]
MSTAASTLGAATAPPLATPLVNRQLVKAHIIAGFTFFFISLFGGLLYALQLSRLYPFPGVELLSPGRVRMLHTNAVAYGFLLNCFMAALYWIVPRLTGERVLSRGLSWVIFGAWQAVVTAAALGILGGHAQAIEWGETPVFVDPFVVIGAALLIANVSTPILRVHRRPLYVTLWYFSAMMVWMPLTYVMGNYVPQFFVPGAGGAAVTGLYIHDLVGLTVTPLGWGMMYYFVPVILKKPVWSHTLSLIGFWGLAFFYPLNGVHHFFYSPIPMYAQYGAVMSTIAVEIVVFTVIVNFFMTLRGRGRLLRENLPVRWFYTGMVLYFVTCLQCAFQTTLTFQKIIHFSDWVVGHAHLVMFGVFGFWILGSITYLWPRLVGRAWWSERLNSWNYWLSTLGIVVMFLDLLVAGVVQGYLWQNLAPWERSLTASQPFWHLRTIAGTAIVVGQMLQAYNLWMTARSGAVESTSGAEAPVAEPAVG